jgi:hypothetical protein
MKTVLAGFRILVVALLATCLPAAARAQHGGGGGHGGGHGSGHAGGSHSGRGSHGHGGIDFRGGRARARGIMRYPPFSAIRLFTRYHHHFSEPFFFSNGFFFGGFIDCGFWDWNCGWGWDDSYFDIGNWTNPSAGPNLPSQPFPAGSAATPSESPLVTVLYLKNGYSVGVTDYWLENDRLYYVPVYGGEDSVPIDRLDLQRTVGENARNSVVFSLRPRSSAP